MKIIKVDKSQNITNLNINIDNLLKDNKKLLHTFEFEDKEVVELYGYTNGIEKNINKLELPKPLENDLFYNDLFFCLKKDNNYEDFYTEDFEDFYEIIFEGFEDLDDYDDDFEQDDDYDYEDGFLINDL